MKEVMNDKQVKHNLITAMRSKDTTELISNNMKEYWRNVKEGSIQRESHVHSDKTKECISNMSKDQWKDQKSRDNILKGIRKSVVWQDPLYSKLYDLWIKYNKPKHIMFSKLIKNDGIDLKPTMFVQLIKHFNKERL